MKSALVAITVAGLAASAPAWAGKAYFDVMTEGGTQIGEIKLSQDEDGEINGGARFRDTLGPESYGEAGGTEYKVSGAPFGSSVTLTLTGKAGAAGGCPLVGSAAPLLIGNETRITGSCALQTLNNGKPMQVILKPHGS
jgi:hypothetical protein